MLSLLVLHFVPQSDRAISELRRVARPGATVAAAVWDARGGFVANRMFFDAAAVLDPKGNERRARNYTRPLTRPGELGAAWHAAGFADIRQATLSIRMEFSYDHGKGRTPHFFRVLPQDMVQASALYLEWGGIRTEGIRRGSTVKGPSLPYAPSVKIWRQLK